MNTSLGEKISVCLLTYNHVDVIESTVRSILNQTVTGYEVMVSDDCSTDGTWQRILAFAKEDARIKLLRTPYNLGMPRNANLAVAHSNRPYVAVLHHDDLYRNDLLEKWAGVLERHPDVGFVFNPYERYGKGIVEIEGIKGNYHGLIKAERIMGSWFLESFLFRRWGCPVRGTAMIRRQAWDQAGGMREQFSLLADVDLWMRLAMHWAVGYVPEPVIVARHQRPSYYPETYKGTSWSWIRQRILYEIHAVNRLAYFKLKPGRRKFLWWVFRLRLNLETIKWLIYALVRRKPSMIATSYEGATNYDLWPLRALRWVLKRVIPPENSISP
jgi:glycosyltransferase involved in cell wall biosynthesis